MERMQGIKMQLQEKIKSHRRKLERKSSFDKMRITTNMYHSYTFRFDRPYVKKVEQKPPLAIKAIEPPPELVAFNTGASLEKWCKKRPRLKSSCKNINGGDKDFDDSEGARSNEDRNGDNTAHESARDEFEQSDEILSCERYFDDEKIYSHRFIEVKKLKNEGILKNRISDKSKEVNNNSSTNSNCSKSRKKHKSRSHKKGKKKRVTLSLAKPAGPETIQVIRVALTSNFSYSDIEDSSIDNDYCRRFKEILKNDDDVEENHVDDYMLTCQKVILAPRDG